MPTEPQASATTRLHISPLDPDILKGILGSQDEAVKEAELSVTYHTIQSEPEKAYGFVSVSPEEAERIRVKFDGKIFRGVRISVAVARESRLERMKRGLEQDGEAESGPEPLRSNVDGQQDLPRGVELENRRVKRGWSQTPQEVQAVKRAKREKREGKSVEGRSGRKFEKGDCLFKQRVSGVSSSAAAPGESLQDGGALGSSKKAKRERSGRGTVVVKEFEKTTKFPTFLKAAPVDKGRTATEYVEEKGWVDDEGNVIEEARASKRPGRRPRSEIERLSLDDLEVEDETTERPAQEDEPAAGSNISCTSSEPGLPSAGPVPSEAPRQRSPKLPSKHPNLRISTAANPMPILPSVESSSSSTSPAASKPKKSKRRSLAASAAALDAPKEDVHFFETTFKPKPNPASSIPTSGSNSNPSHPQPSSEEPTTAPSSFRFFDPDPSDDSDERSTSLIPQTPGTVWRRERSTAPTPDTASLGPNSRPPWARSRETTAGLDGSSLRDDDGDAAHLQGQGAGNRRWTRSQDKSRQVGGSRGGIGSGGGGGRGGDVEPDRSRDFREVFYEVRGQTNRTWKVARKEALKEQRRREERNWEGRVGIRRGRGGE